MGKRLNTRKPTSLNKCGRIYAESHLFTAETRCHTTLCISGDDAMRTTVLCVSRNEKDLAVRKLLLETRGYRVQLALTEREVLIGSQQGCYEDVKLLIC